MFALFFQRAGQQYKRIQDKDCQKQKDSRKEKDAPARQVSGKAEKKAQQDKEEIILLQIIKPMPSDIFLAFQIKSRPVCLGNLKRAGMEGRLRNPEHIGKGRIQGARDFGKAVGVQTFFLEKAAALQHRVCEKGSLGKKETQVS